MGAGENSIEAALPTAIDVPEKGRVLTFAFGLRDSGIPPEWAAAPQRDGVSLLDDLSEATANDLSDHIRRSARQGDVIIVSIHWGGNWGYDIAEDQIQFAHRLVDAGVHIVHGHSSHHVKALEVYMGKPIIYGSGDFVDDYEGIGGHDPYRDDLRALFDIRFDTRASQLERVEIILFQPKRLRLQRASARDTQWLCDLLNKLCSRFRTSADVLSENRIAIHWQ